jgi:Delta14-sterol reductase
LIEDEKADGLCRPGAFAIVFILPLLVMASLMFCNETSGCPAPGLLDLRTLTLAKLKTQTPWPENGIIGLFDAEAIGWTLAYYGLLVVLQLVLPGEEVEGTLLSDGAKLHYKFNSWRTTLLLTAGLTTGTVLYGADWIVWTFIWDKLVYIFVANLLIAYGLAAYCYIGSFTVPHPGQPNPDHRELAKGGHSGNILYDFMIGRELNPRVAIPAFLPLVGGQVLDIKLFMEMRPGLMGWIILDCAHIAHQYRLYGEVTDSIVFITIFQALYVFDAMYMEPAILTTIDCIMDGFGFMLAFGDVAWLPFIYSIQTRYLSVHPVKLGYNGVAGVLAVTAVGYYIFRSSNNEKNRFRTNPNDPKIAHLQSMSTASGSKLLTSGWWGTARHINYLGDWIMSWAFCLPTGFAGYVAHHSVNALTGKDSIRVEQGDAKGWGMIFTYFYIVYFGVLLVHRELRDEAKCKRKYGKDWDKYCQIVKWKIIPYVY